MQTPQTHQAYNYIVAMVKHGNRKQGSSIKPLYVGRGYTKAQAEVRAFELNNSCQEELKALDHDVFVAYNIFSE